MIVALDTWLQACLEHPFSDMHVRTNQRPVLRIHGAMVSDPSWPVVLAQDVDDFRHAHLSAHDAHIYAQRGDADAALQVNHLRLRVNFFRASDGPACAIRRLAASVPTMQALGLPQAAQDAIHANNGLILVTGPTGSGKSTTLAAMVAAIHASRSVHTITLEDPVEYVYQQQQGLITQRQIGRDVHDFATGLRAALREDPDVILIGELRDPETIQLALTAAETGHLVLGTLHTRSARTSVTRIIDSLPAEQQDHVRVQLSESLRLTLTQELWPRADVPGRIAAFEVMVCTPAVRNMIREDKSFQLDNVLQTSRQLGMQTMQSSLQDLRLRGLIAP
jgi:twitching motility protein PilT